MSKREAGPGPASDHAEAVKGAHGSAREPYCDLGTLDQLWLSH